MADCAKGSFFRKNSTVQEKHSAVLSVVPCRTQHSICWDFERIRRITGYLFQCRTQHYMCWDSVVPSPCPTWAEKPFWKVVRFSRCFCCRNAFSRRKIAWQIVSVPCPARAAPFWKVATVECGLRAPMDHFPLFASITIIAQISSFFNNALRATNIFQKSFIVSIDVLFSLCYTSFVIKLITK